MTSSSPSSSSDIDGRGLVMGVVGGAEYMWAEFRGSGKLGREGKGAESTKRV